MTEYENNEQQRHRKTLERVSYAEKGRFFKVRNVLNWIFIIMAIAGMAIYFYSSQAVGGAILIACVFIKIAECVLRIIH